MTFVPEMNLVLVTTPDLAASARVIALFCDDARANHKPDDVRVLREALDRVELELRRRGAHQEVRSW